MQIRVQDDIILAAHVADAPVLFERIVTLRPGESIRLSVNGVHGTWVKISMHHRDGTRHGLAPVGAMAEIWKSLRSSADSSVDLEILPPINHQTDDYLRLVETSMPEWNTQEDEEAYGGLRPL